VVYKGEILSGFDMEAVCQDLSRISSISAEHAKKILEGGRDFLSTHPSMKERLLRFEQ
jgi:Zn-dependent protease with chaperone function